MRNLCVGIGIKQVFRQQNYAQFCQLLSSSSTGVSPASPVRMQPGSSELPSRRVWNCVVSTSSNSKSQRVPLFCEESRFRSSCFGRKFSTSPAPSETSKKPPHSSEDHKGSENGGKAKGMDVSLEEVVETLEQLQEENKKLQSAVEELEQMNKASLDKYRLALADTENLRKRMERQIKEAKEYGIQSFCKDLLEVPDILRAAIESVKDEALVGGEGKTLKDMHEGLKMTESVLLKIFSKHGLEQMNPLGEKFDPNFHEALFRVPPDDTKRPDTVGSVAKVGYSLHGRPVRPAQVGVVQNP